MEVTLNNLKPGEYFKKTQEARTVWVRGHYVRELKAFSCTDFDDINREVFIKSKRPVFIGFEF